MFRKTALALTTIATLGAAALAPTTASAGYHGHWHRHGYKHHHFFKHSHFGYGYGYCFWKPFYGYYGYKRWVKICL